MDGIGWETVLKMIIDSPKYDLGNEEKTDEQKSLLEKIASERKSRIGKKGKGYIRKFDPQNPADFLHSDTVMEMNEDHDAKIKALVDYVNNSTNGRK